MYRAIQITDRSSEKKEDIITQFTLDPLITESVNEDLSPDTDKLFTEAVFENGKQSVLPLVDHFSKIKDLLMTQIEEQDKTINSKNKKDIKSFDPKLFWKSTLFKDLEDEISKIFGFRTVQIHSYIERYISSEKKFESKILNCEIYNMNRYPIEGLVTDKGFYDKSKSLIMEVHFSLGLIKALTPEEITAVLLHEFGHSIDPALVDITYTETNILSKYLTDRKGSINKNEQKLINKRKSKKIVLIPYMIKSLGWNFSSFLSNVKNSLVKHNPDSYKAGGRMDSFFGIFTSKNKREQKKLDEIKKLIDEDKEEFNRQNYSEAFADNFARMYGFGSQLASGIKKMTLSMDNDLHSRIKKEKARQAAIIYLTKMLLKDVHKTDIHRIRSLIKEYENDLKDPNLSEQTKKGLKEDLDELNKVLDGYLNHFDEFQARVNRTINEELIKIESSSNTSTSTTSSKSTNDPSKKNKDNKVENHNESSNILDEELDIFTESKKAYEKIKKEINAITSSERAEFYKIFGRSLDCSLAKDKNGYYVRTHRCRSKSYPNIKDIPKKSVDFVRSTS